MKIVALVGAFALIAGSLFAQGVGAVGSADLVAVPPELAAKIESGRLIGEVSKKMVRVRSGLMKTADAAATVLLYFNERPSGDRLAALRDLGVRCYWETWTPPLEGHPLGFVVATLPVASFINTLGLDFVTRMGTAEARHAPRNNLAVRSIRADSAWSKGWTGSGIKVAVLDSGLDTDPANPDLPAVIQARDYSSFPNAIRNTVLNKVTGHGTHVTGTVLGRGTLSSGNTLNGGGAYKGMAPLASLVFLKIGDDTTANSSYAADVAAMHAAVDTFQANVLSMSYGGWDAYHDGSDAEDQVVDWVYSRGVPFFIAAGNEADGNLHYSGSVGARDSTGPIPVFVTGAKTNSTMLAFNLVWRSTLDSPATSMDLRYYGNLGQVVPATIEQQTTSSRGTNSEYSGSTGYVPPGNSAYNLRVVNNSARPLRFHIYEDFGDGKVAFAVGDPNYTISQPASADHAFAVGAYVSRTNWTAYNGIGWQDNYAPGNIAPWSSRGPRVDGRTKPDIAAPGSLTISMRDRRVYASPDRNWVSSVGTSADTAYYVMQGTSMATPVAAGAAAILLGKTPSLTAEQVFSAMTAGAISDQFTGGVPNTTWGGGKLNVYAAVAFSTDIQPPAGTPIAFSLGQNYPNPFNPSTVIDYVIPRTTYVTLEVFDILGRTVRTIVSGEQGFGPHSVRFDGAGLSSGVYFYRLKADGVAQTRKLIVLR
ncbi:MAG TPA: S8/S53 family peptidase [Bacteroidota bacterium]